MSQMQVIGMASSSISVPSPAASLGQMRGSLTMPASHAGGAAVAFRPGAQPGVRNWSPGISARPTRPAASPVNSLAATPARPPAPAYAFASGQSSNTVCSATRRGREPPMEHVLNEGGSLTIAHHRSPVASPSPSPSPQAAWAQPGACITQGIRSAGNSSTDSTLRPVPATRSINSSNEGVLSDRSPPLPGPALLPLRSGATATLPAEERGAAGGGDAGQTRLTTSVSSLASSASVPTLTSERVTSRVQPPVHQLHSLHQPQHFTRDALASGANVLSSGHSSEEARFAELQRQLLQAREDSASNHRLAEERAQEVGTLLARVEMLLARISERDAEVLRLRAAKYQDEMQGRQIASLRSATSATGAVLNDPKEVAARRLQRAIRPWLAALHRRRDDSSALARDRWKQMLEEVEASVSRALEHAIGKEDVGRVPRQTRLQLLGNTLKHGVLRVNQVMMQQTLQDMRKNGPSKDTSPSPTPSR